MAILAELPLTVLTINVSVSSAELTTTCKAIGCTIPNFTMFMVEFQPCQTIWLVDDIALRTFYPKLWRSSDVINYILLP